MTVLVAAVVLVGALGAVNLLFCLGVVRRLREHTEILNEMSAAPALILPAGKTVADFAAVTVAGTPVSRGSLAGPTLVAFFSPGCGPCAEQLPRFADLVRGRPPGRVLAVVCGGDEVAAAPMVEPLREVAEVVREDGTGPMQEAFAVRGFPTFAVVEPGGLVRTAAQRVDALTEDTLPARALPASAPA
jgi:thiol-disulfide isomerase/thioredoxin